MRNVRLVSVFLGLSLVQIGCGTADTATDRPYNQADASKLLVLTQAEPEGENCSAGGVQLRIGANGVDGIDAIDSVAGLTGATGTTGTSALIRTTVELLGPNCLLGGLKVTSGIDTNRNAVLGDAEVTGTCYLCALKAVL